MVLRPRSVGISVPDYDSRGPVLNSRLVPLLIFSKKELPQQTRSVGISVPGYESRGPVIDSRLVPWLFFSKKELPQRSPGFVVAVRNDCDFDEQCSMTTPQTECRDGKCMCQGNMHPYVKDNITQCFVRGEKKIGDKCEESLDCGYDGGVCDKTKKPICQCSPELPVTNHIDKCGKGSPIDKYLGKEEKGNRPITPQSNSARKGGYLKRASTHARGAGDERLKLEMIYFDIFSGVTIQVELNVGHQQRSNRTMTASAWLRNTDSNRSRVPYILLGVENSSTSALVDARIKGINLVWSGLTVLEKLEFASRLEGAINESCFFNEQCEHVNYQTECRDGRCMCRYELTPVTKQDGTVDCIGE
uniref:(California timema) hypothetical protein n=1 Tax=Timema californicum TaxID=61474 RepID=A0A7R9J2D2_TIMCA|nr:unnamed protein product [Timema californicum]